MKKFFVGVACILAIFVYFNVNKLDADHPDNIVKYLIKLQEEERGDAYDPWLRTALHADAWYTNFQPMKAKDIQLEVVEGDRSDIDEKADGSGTYYASKISYKYGSEHKFEELVAGKTGDTWKICPFGVVAHADGVTWTTPSGLVCHATTARTRVWSSAIVFLYIEEAADHENGVALGWDTPPEVWFEMQDGSVVHPTNKNAWLRSWYGVEVPETPLRVSHDHPVLVAYPLPSMSSYEKDVKGTIDTIVIDRAYSLTPDGQNPVDPDGAVVRLDHANLPAELHGDWKSK